MRVISGAARGRKLQTLAGMRVRPTADRVKEALFSIILSCQGILTGTRVLDLCAGTGGLGIEALSRGAAQAVFVDNHRESAALISRNLTICGFIGQSRVVVRDAVTALYELEQKGERFELVFLDPPYRMGITEQLLAVLGASGVLTEDALVIAEHARDELLPEEPGCLRHGDRRVYGDTAVSFYQVRDREPVTGDLKSSTSIAGF